MSLIDMQLLLVLSLSLFFYSSSYLSKKPLISTQRRLLLEQRALYEQILQQWNNPPKPKPRDPPTETEELISYVNYKPWRAPKVKYLKKHYKPWSASWQERFRTSEDDVIYIYTIKNNRELYECTRGIDMYAWPFLWTRNKIDRHAWIQKCFDSDITAMTVQDHMELDAFHSEFDMPLRWCMFRLYEAVELNSLVLYLVLFFDFYGIAPTDRGLRPDLTLKTCPVQFHQCISSSNSPLDTEHYAPPFKWSRTKSPDQAITEIKNIYENYPKRGLKWASGWIDRGGWYPQQFNGNYFYAQGRSLIWHYTDDIELLINLDSREVSFRSSARLGQTDNDVQRLRYNQFVRMLAANKDWEVQELPLLHYEWNIVRTWAQHFLDDQVRQVDRLTDTVLTRLQLQTVTLPSLPSLPSFPLPQETWLSKLDDVENSLSSFWKPLMMSDGLNAAVEEKVVQIEQFLHSFDRHDEITSQEERKEDRTSSLIIPNTQLTTSSDVAPTASTSSSITPVEERKRVRNFKEVKQEFKKEVRRLDREDFFKRFSDSSNDNDKAYIDDNDLSDQMEEDEVDKKIGEGRRGKKLIEPLFSSSFSSYKSKLSAKARHYPQYS